MKLTIQKAVVFLAGAACILCVALSFLTVQTFPPINIDEVSNAVMAGHFWRTGLIICPLVQGVIHPYFADLNSVDPQSLRGVYVAVLGFFQSVASDSFVAQRLFSLGCWLASGLIWAGVVRRHAGTAVAVLTLAIWLVSFDGRLSAHLIRPDALLIVLYAICLWLAFSPVPFSEGMKWCLMGFFSVLGVGLHPNGLLLCCVVAFLLIILKWGEGHFWALAANAASGALAGALVFGLLADIPSFALSRHGYVMTLFAQSKTIWIERLWPWNLIGDIGLYYLRPTSFYAREPLFNNHVLYASGLAQLVGYGLLLMSFVKRGTGFLKTIWLLSGVLFLGLSLGRTRGELIYNLPLTMLSASLLAWLLISSARDFSEQWSKLADKFGFFMAFAALLLASYVFRYSVYFSLFLLLTLVKLNGASDKTFLAAAGVGLFSLFSFWIKAKDHLNLLGEMQGHFLGSFSGGFCLTALIVMVIILAFRFRHMSAPAVRNILPPLLTGAISLWVVAVMGFSSIYHEISIARRNAPVEETWKQVTACADESVQKVLGPSLFWFPYREKFRDTNSFTLDYFYSGQRRARECMERFQPDMLILEESMRRRFFGAQELKNILRGPVNLCRVVEPTLHHGRLEVYRLSWVSGKERTSGETGQKRKGSF